MADTKISALTAATSITDDDLLVMVDDPAGTPATKKITALNAKGYFGGGAAVAGLATGSGAATANRTAIQAALDAAETAGGGTVLIPVGRWQIDGTLNLGSRVVLAGFGWGSILQLANSVASAASPVPMVKAKANTNYVGVEDLLLDGNKANQTDTNYASHGVDFTRSGTENNGDTRYDGSLRCRNVRVESCMGVGLAAYGSATTMRVTDCEAYHNDDAGFFMKTDCEVANCVAANNGGYGLRVYSATSVRLTSVKCFGNCQRYQGTDFLIHYCNTVMMSDCQAEDSGQCGYVFTAINHLTALGVHAYRCAGHLSDANRSAFWVEDDGAGNQPHHITIVGDALCSGGASSFNYTLTTRDLSDSVDIQIKTEGQAVARWHHLSGSSSGRISFGDQVDGAVQFPAYAASYTPDQYKGAVVALTLTGNITIGAPAEPIQGQSLRFIFTQDGTGGRTVTWDAAFKPGTWTPTTTASKVNVIEFQYNGVAWVKVAEAVNL